MNEESKCLHDLQSLDCVRSERVYYHITLAENIESICKNGLVPQIGARSVEAGESNPAVFLFRFRGDAEDSLGCWLGKWYGEHYGEDWEPVIIQVRLPDDIPVFETGTDWERICKVTIPPECLSFYSENWERFPVQNIKYLDEQIKLAVAKGVDRGAPAGWEEEQLSMF